MAKQQIFSFSLQAIEAELIDNFCWENRIRRAVFNRECVVQKIKEIKEKGDNR